MLQVSTRSSVDSSPKFSVRRLWAHEWGLWEGHLLRLDREDRRMRFSGPAGDAAIRRYCSRAGFLDAALFGAFIDGELRGVGEFRLLPGGWPRHGELAFSVEGRWQGLGIGATLFRRLVTFARNRTLGKLFLVTASGNRAMRTIAAKAGMELHCEDGDVEGRMRLRWPTWASMMEEWVAESSGFWREWAWAGAIR